MIDLFIMVSEIGRPIPKIIRKISKISKSMGLDEIFDI
jgi:hypothetical protein